KLLLLDEPAGGLNHEEVGTLGALIQRIRAERGLTVLLVEHHMSLVMQVSDKVVVLDFGRKIAEVTPAEVQRNPEVIRAYLGSEEGVRLGIAHAPEGRGTFVHLTVEENLKLGAWGRRERGNLKDDFERVFGYFPVLRERRRQAAGTLSGGEQQMLSVARALML